jgi:prepilin peptidase CpaA
LNVNQFSVALFCLLLAAAAGSDVASRRVPNALPVAMAVLGVAVQLGAGGARAALHASGAALLLVAVLLVPFSRRMLGGGDVKMAAACVVWTGLPRLPTFLVGTALAGGVVALVTAALALRTQTVTVDAAANVARADKLRSIRRRLRTVRVPYSIAIAAGAVLALEWGTP